MVDDKSSFEYAGEMEGQSEHQRDVKGPDGITIVWETTIIVVLKGESLDLKARESNIEDPFYDDKSPINHPRIASGPSTLNLAIKTLNIP